MFRLAGRTLVIVALALGLALSFSMVSFAALDHAGDLDPTFGQGGKVTAGFTYVENGVEGPSYDQGSAVAAQSDGKIVVGGSTGNIRGGHNAFVLLRYNLDGSLDTSFGVNGKVQNGFPDTSQPLGDAEAKVRAIAILDDGKILVYGLINSSLSLVRYNSDGSLDTSFGTNGVFYGPGVVEDWSANNMIIQPDHKIVLSGGSGNNVQVARILPEGALDTSFGNNGVATTAVSARPPGGDGEPTCSIGPCWSDSAIVKSIALLPNNKIVVAGAADSTYHATAKNSPQASIGYSGYALLTYNSDGSLDTGFATNGVMINDIANHWVGYSAILALPDGKFITSDYGGGLTRFMPDGSVDSTFTPNFAAPATALALQSDGKIVAAGTVGEFVFPKDFLVARYNSDGKVDTTFGVNGLATTDFDADDVVGGLAILPDQRIVVVGTADAAHDGDFAIARYISETGPSASCTLNFSDVTSGDYFYAPTHYLFCQGAISGYSDNTFRPYNATTRVQLAKIIVVVEGWPLESPDLPHFVDVPPDDVFYTYVETAYKHGVISGYDDHTSCGLAKTHCFNATNPVTRGQLAKIVVHANNWPLLNPTTPTFSDVDASNPFYQEIETAMAHGVISGYDLPNNVGKEFRWQESAIRAQIAKIVYLAETGN